MKRALVLQPFGLGDCIFAQGVAHHFIQHGYHVVWPVQNYLDELRIAYPLIEWLPENLPDARHIIGATAVPIRWSDTIMGVPYKYVMRAKYDMYSLDWQEWRTYAGWRRNHRKEMELYNLLGLNGTEYTLVSDLYTGQFKPGRLPLNLGTNIVRIKPIAGYSLFDWAYVMEGASALHFVASSNIYLLELLNLKAACVHLYTRAPEQPHHKFYDYILQKQKYIFL